MPKTTCITMVVALMLGLGATALCGERIQLPPPAKSGGPSLAQALAERRSSREFADVELSQQQLSDLLWSAAGVNRPDGKKVYPVAMNRQDMIVYAVTRQGAYRYDPAAHALELIVSGDHRADTGSQPFVGSAAVNLVYVHDRSLWEDRPEHAQRGRDWGFAHAGEITQNAHLYAAGQGWSAVVRGMFDPDTVSKLLNLDAKKVPLLIHSIGPAR